MEYKIVNVYKERLLHQIEQPQHVCNTLEAKPTSEDSIAYKYKHFVIARTRTHTHTHTHTHRNKEVITVQQ